MFCPKCGTQIADTATVCPSCNTPVSIPAASGAGPAPAEKMKAASKDAVQAFKTFALDPVGKLATAYESLGAARALLVGIIFGVIAAICFIISIYRILDVFRPTGFDGFIKVVLVSIVPFVSLTLAAF